MKKLFFENKISSLLWGTFFYIGFMIMDFALSSLTLGSLFHSTCRLFYSVIVMYAFFKIFKTDKIFREKLSITLRNKVLITLLIVISLLLYFIVNSGCEQITLIFSHDIEKIISVISLALAAGLFEEFLTRGFLFKYFLTIGGSNKLFMASVYSSIIFGTLHLSNIFTKGTAATFQQIFYASVIGLLFSALRIAFNGLLVTVLLHSLIDLQLDLLKPTVGETAPSWIPILVIFIPIAIISIITILSLEREDYDVPLKS